MAWLRRQTTIAFSSHEPDLIHAARHGAPDAVVINLTVLGGIRRTIAFVNAAELLGVDVWFYSPDTGVGNAAYLQIAGALEWISEPSQTLLRWHADDIITGGQFVPRDGGIDVPTGPGLGVELDRDALRRCHEAFLEEGPSNPYLDPIRPNHYGPRNIFLGAGDAEVPLAE
jgi:glucarate dehydratase